MIYSERFSKYESPKSKIFSDSRKIFCFSGIIISLLALQTAYLFIPLWAVSLFVTVIQPLVYAVSAVGLYAAIGNAKRPKPQAFGANITAAFSILAFGVTIFIALFLFGGGVNSMTQSLGVIINNIWQIGSIVLLGECIRYLLINNALKQSKDRIAFIASLALAYGHMTGLRILINSDAANLSVFFESVFSPLVISMVAGYYAIKGSFPAAIAVSFVFTMASRLLPVLPNIVPTAFTLIIAATAALPVFISYIFIKEEMREKRVGKYTPVSIFNYLPWIAVFAVMLGFFAGMFRIYPTIVLTNSMYPTFASGSIVFVERVPEGEAFFLVDEGDIIHLAGPGRREYLHRVIGFMADATGERRYITQGDASYLPDPWATPQEDVLGIVRAALPFIGEPFVFFRSIFGTG